MIQDIANYDLIDLSMARKWPEEEQAAMVLGFNEALGGYITENISKYFDEKSNEEFKVLIKDPGITEEKVIEFYNTKIPNTKTVIDRIMLDFKKIFLLKIYENKVNELKSSNETQDTGLLSKWEGLLVSAQQDNWTEVFEQISRLDK